MSKKSHAVISSASRTTEREYFTKSQGDMVAEPVCVNSKMGRGGVDGLQPSLQDRIYDLGGEMVAVTTAFNPNIAEPVNVTTDGKSHTIKAQYYKNGTANFISNDGFDATAVAEPINITEDGKSRTLIAQYGAKQSYGNFLGITGFGSTGVAEQIRVGALPRPNGELSTGQAFQIYSEDGKSVTLCANGGGAGGKTGLYAIRVTDGKEQKLPIYKVENGQIEIKGKLYPIKLSDGYYIIRKLSVSECKRLQTVPEWYEFPVSNTQAYKMLGNGWTCEVIVHLISSIRKEVASNG